MTAFIDTLWSSDNTVPLTTEEAVLAIQNSRRRHVLVLLDEQDEPMTTSQLAEEIAAIEQDKEISQLNSQERKRVYIALYQKHLSKLDEVDAINYNERSKEVHVTKATPGLAGLIRHLESVCDPVSG